MNDFLYHSGEREAQQRTGERDLALRNGRVISGALPPRAISFVSQQQMLVLGSTDPRGYAWASVLFGRSGFAIATDPRRIEVDLTATASNPEDPLWRNLSSDPMIGLLFIEFETRRRLRVNGTAELTSEHLLGVTVSEAYPNCPKYIQRRSRNSVSPLSFPSLHPARRGTTLGDPQLRQIQTADTFFVASLNSGQGSDVSHRGGYPGFVQILDSQTLLVPDYPGNSLYNTLGNFVTNPVAGLLFLDFKERSVLQISGQVEIHWTLNRPPEETGGTRRYWSVIVREWLESRLPAEVDWEFLDYSSLNPGEAPR